MKLKKIYAQIPSSKCPEGCGECCGPVYPSLKEMQNIRFWCVNHGMEFKDFATLNDLSCPYLMDDKRCQIYDARPFMCRTYGMINHKLLRCAKCKPERIMSNPEMNKLYKKIYKGEAERILSHREEILSNIAKMLARK